MFTGVAVTLDIVVLAGLIVCAGGLGAVALHGVHSIRRRLASARDHKQSQANLAEILRTDDFNREIDDAAERRALRPARSSERTDTMLRARIDHLRQVQQVWGSETRHNALEQIAAIMKRSVRRGNGETGSGDVVNEIDGDGFTILVRNAEESEASLIAKRLRDEIARSRIDGLSDNVRVTASFGVASRRVGESFAMWRERAEAALRRAGDEGEDQIVEASVVEEVQLLGPPSPGVDPKAA